MAVDGHSVAYRVAGHGQPVVLLHGFLCDSRCWRPQLINLVDRFKVVAWDAPGAGSSSDPPNSFTLEDWADLLAHFLDSLEVTQAHIVGLSWGGMLAQELYRRHPSYVSRLVLCDTYAGWKGSFRDDLEAVEKRRSRCYRDAARPAAEVVAEWVPKDFFASASQELISEMGAVVADFHPLGFRLMAKALADGDTTDILTTIRVPTLLVWGDSDLRSPLTVAEEFQRLIPHSELAVIQQAGHVSNMERPKEFNSLVRNFLLRG